MTEGRPVVVGIDGSPGSRTALARARALAATAGTRLVVVSVVDPEVPSSAEDAIRSELGRLAPEAEVELRTGRPFVELIGTAREVDARLIVLGAFGEHTAGPFALGATVDRVARKADRPVLVVRRPPEDGYRAVVVGLDGSPEAEAAVRLARELAPDARITGVLAAPPVGKHWLEVHRFSEDEVSAYLATWQRGARERLRDWARRLPLDDHEVDLRRAEVALVETARRVEADLLAVGRRGPNRAPAVLLGRVAHHLLHEAPCDVLVHRPPDLDFEPP